MENTSLPHKLLDETIGISIKIISDEFSEVSTNTFHKVVFQIKEEEHDIFAVGILFNRNVESGLNIEILFTFLPTACTTT